MPTVSTISSPLRTVLGFKNLSLRTTAIGVATWKSLNFAMEHQSQDQWCWAATSFSVDRYFNNATSWSQCKVVNAELGQTGCCNNGSTAACNKPWYLDRALQRVGNLDAVSSGKPGFSGVKTEIDQSQPLCLRIGWNGGGGHFVAISAYDENGGNPLITVDDPWYGRSTGVSFNNFPSSYHGGGTWTHTYTTR